MFPSVKLGEKVMRRNPEGFVDLDLPFHPPRCLQLHKAPARPELGLFLYPCHDFAQCRTRGTCHPRSVCCQDAPGLVKVCQAHITLCPVPDLGRENIQSIPQLLCFFVFYPWRIPAAVIVLLKPCNEQAKGLAISASFALLQML